MRTRREQIKKKLPERRGRLRDRNIFIREPLLLEAPQDLLGISNDQLGEMFQTADFLLEQGANADAVRAFTMLCHIHPYVPDFWCGLGRALCACGLHEDALGMLLTAETMDPSRFEFYRDAIHCCLEMGQKKEATHIFRRLRAHRHSIDYPALSGEIKSIERLLSTKK